MTGDVLALRGVHFSYPGGVTVLAGADLGVAAGNRIALLGSNGSGKTTLLRCLAGALRPSGGIVTRAGVPVDYTRSGLREHRTAVQLVVQDPDDQLFSASVRDDVSFGPVNLGLGADVARDRVAEALALLAIEHLRDRPTHLLSFGERKRVAIAGAVAMRPAVLLLDEPTAGLDPAGVAEALAALERLHAVGTAIVLSTHDVDLALRWADQVAVVVAGQVTQGEPNRLLCDDGLLNRARLRQPWVLGAATRLAGLGLLEPGAMPRTGEELLDLLPAAPPGRQLEPRESA